MKFEAWIRSHNNRRLLQGFCRKNRKHFQAAVSIGEWQHQVVAHLRQQKHPDVRTFRESVSEHQHLLVNHSLEQQEKIVQFFSTDEFQVPSSYFTNKLTRLFVLKPKSVLIIFLQVRVCRSGVDPGIPWFVCSRALQCFRFTLAHRPRLRQENIGLSWWSGM